MSFRPKEDTRTDWLDPLKALALLAVGVVLGEPTQVLMKAANVCLACMGVG